MPPSADFPARPVLVLVLSLVLGGCGDDPSEPDGGSDEDASAFVGTWIQNHQSSDGTCFGPLETDGQFVLKIRETGGQLEVVTLDQGDLTQVLCTEPLEVSGGIATVDGSHSCIVPAGATDPIMLETATNDVVIRFSVDRFELESGTLHEAFQATHDDGTTECTFRGQAEYVK